MKDIYGVKEGEPFEVFPAFTNSTFWWTSTDTPEIVCLHERDGSSYYEQETPEEYVRQFIAAKTYQEQFDCLGRCFYGYDS